MALARVFVCGLAMVASASPLIAQTAPAAANPTISVESNAQIAERGRALMDEARKSPTGFARVVLESYPGHTVMLVARSKTGLSETHASWNDVMFVLDGEATEVTGGTVVGGKLDAATGETAGSGVEGGTRTAIRKGDVIHIPTNTPHWAILDPGKTLLVCIVKVAASAK